MRYPIAFHLTLMNNEIEDDEDVLIPAVSEEVGRDIVEGIRCPGCTKLVVIGYPCFCIDELEGLLGEAHKEFRWCSDDCLHENHEESTWPKLGEYHGRI